MRAAHPAGNRTTLRWISVAVLLTMSVAAARSGIGGTRVSSPLAGIGVAVDAVTVGLLGVALIGASCLVVLVARRPRRRRDEPDIRLPPWEATRWARFAALLFALALLAAPIAAFFAIGHLSTGNGNHPATPVPATTHAASPSARSGPSSNPHDAHTYVVLSVSAAVIVLVLVAWYVDRRRRAVVAEQGSTDGPQPSQDSTDHAAPRLAEVAEPGSPRAEVIDSFVAMSHLIRDAEGDSVATLTPRRMLRRGLAAGVVDRRNGEILTRLFERARYGNETIGENDRRRAVDALARLRRHRGVSGIGP